MIVDFEVIDDRRVGEGGFLRLRRLRLRMIRDDGTRTDEGLYDYVERPVGLDAVVLALFHRAPGGRVEVLVRDGLRIPLSFGRGGAPRVELHTELVAGILETGEDDDAKLRARAIAEAHEEAGVTIEARDVVALGAATFPTAGMCPELFHFVAAEVSDAQRDGAAVPPGDGSPFEEGARVRWVELDGAIADCARGAIPDLKTELGLRRLKDYLASK